MLVRLAPDDEVALAVLGRLHGPERWQDALRLGDATESVGDASQGDIGIEFAGNQQDGVVRLVVHVVEALQVLDADIFDIAAVADRRAAVAVPVISDALQPLEQHVSRIVFAHLELVPDHRHLGVEVLPGDEGIDHAVCLERNRPGEIVIGGRQQFVIVGPVEPCRAIEAGAALLEFLRDIVVRRRALEHQVLEQVGHAGLAVVLVARADQIGDVDRQGWLRGIGKQQHMQTVVEPVFGNALDLRDERDACWQRRHVGERRGA